MNLQGETVLTFQIFDIILAAFIVYLGRVAFGTRSAFSGIFFGMMLTIVLYYELAFIWAITIPTISWEIPTSLSATSILLASTGEKLLKLRGLRARMPITADELEMQEQIL